MSIEKNNKNTLVHEDGGFTTALNETIQNIKHTGALGLYIYLASMPPDWDICKNQLQDHFGCGKEHMNTCFKYLKDIGAIEVIMNRNEKGQSIGWNTILKRKINIQSVPYIQKPENPNSGQFTRNRKTQILGFQESGKPALIKETTKTKEIKRKKTNKETPSVSVFSNSVSIRFHLDSIIKNRSLQLSDEVIKEIMFYIGEEKDFDTVIKKINIALKAIRNGKWKTPYGFNTNPNSSTPPTRIKPETVEERNERYRLEREMNMRKRNSQ
jgi:hypothetical protein